MAPVEFIQRPWRHARREIYALLVAAALLEGLLVLEGLSRSLRTGELLESVGQRLQTLATVFLGIFFEAVPFLLLGALLAALLRVHLRQDLIGRLAASGSFPAALLGACLGVVTPACECAAVAVGRRMLGKGAPVSLGLAFMLAAPVANPLVLTSTWAAFGSSPGLVAGRLLVAVVLAIGVGVLFGLHASPASLLARNVRAGIAPSGRGAHSVVGLAAEEFLELAPYLVVGGLVAAALQTFVPRAALMGVGHDPLLSVVAMMLMAILLSVCSSVDAFIAASFAGIFLPGALLAFMVFGPIVNLKSAAMYGTALSRKATLVLVVVSAQLIFVAGALVNLNFA